MTAQFTHRAGLATSALLTRAAFLVIARVRIDDAEVRPTPGRGAIIAINHRSMLDFFVGTIAFRQWGVYPRTFARGDFFTRPVLGVALRLVGAIPAGRGRGAAVTFRLARDVLCSGGVVAIAPEGRVVAPAERPAGLGELKGGVGVMSSRRGTPILLAAIQNTDVAWPLGRRAPRVHLPWNRPTITVSVARLEVQPGTPPAVVTEHVAEGLRDLLGTAPQPQERRDPGQTPASISPSTFVGPST
jgi:1-acyl-sn-glycerol-3-phosphate acyltransferase